MKKLMNLIVLSCQKATFLIEKSHDKPLSFLDRMQLSMHLKICDKCAEYEKQSFFIENVLKTNNSSQANPFNFKLPEDSKLRIKRVIDEKIK